jgi:uncharacterized protein YprB with RNaseH-like and TPR domain
VQSERLKEWLRRAYRRREAPAPSPEGAEPFPDAPEPFPESAAETVVSIDADFPLAPLARAIGGEVAGDAACPVLIRNKVFPLAAPVAVSSASLRFIVGDSTDCDRVSRSLESGRFLAFDTETTGLAGGTGTLVFLAGFARMDLPSSTVQVCQYFLPDPASEPAFLDRLGSRFAPDALLITYNGLAFDYPLIRTRFRLHRRADPPVGAHLDLLPAARRLLKFYIPDRSLPSVEASLLRKPRLNDIPGELIPREYQMFLRFGEIGRLPEVFEHNLRDLLSLFDLLRTLGELATPLGRGSDPRIALARGVFQTQLGADDDAFSSLSRAFGDIEKSPDYGDPGMSEDHICRLCRELGVVSRRLGHWETALQAWRFWASRFAQTAPCVEIAKYYEHEARDLERALEWAVRARNLSYDPREGAEIAHRIARLQRRLGRSSVCSPAPGTAEPGPPPR